MTDKTCKTCIHNEDGFCDHIGVFVEDDDTCNDYTPDWRDAVLRTFLGGR